MGDAPGPDGVVCGYHCDAWTIAEQCPMHSRDAKVDRFIKRLDDELTLEPWQAVLIRQVLRNKWTIDSHGYRMPIPGSNRDPV